MNNVQKSSVTPSRRGNVTSESTTVKRILATKRGSVVDASQTRSQTGFSCSFVFVSLAANCY